MQRYSNQYNKYQTYPVLSMLKKELETRQFILETPFLQAAFWNFKSRNKKKVHTWKDHLNDGSQKFPFSTYVFSSKPWILSPQLLISQFWMVDCIGDWQDQRKCKKYGSISVIPSWPHVNKIERVLSYVIWCCIECFYLSSSTHVC